MVKNIQWTFFSRKIKGSEKQKCVYILFLLNSRILLRLNHRITENLQTWKLASSGMSPTDYILLVIVLSKL